MIVFILLVTSAVCSSLASPSCTLSEWGAWSEWATPHHDVITRESFEDLPVSGAGDSMRYVLMDKRQAAREELEECRMDGTCPQLSARASEGYAPCTNGYINDQIPCWNVDQQSYMNFSDLLDPTAEGNDIWGWTDPQTGIEYAIQGLTTGTTFVDISDPNNPVAIAHIPSTNGSSDWRDIKTIKNHAYIVAEAQGHGIQVFDLTRLRTITPGSIISPDLLLGEVGNCHNVVANEDTDFIYAVGCTDGSHCAHLGGLYAVDVSDPANPQPAGCFDDDGYTHDAQCVIYHGDDVSYQGKEICLCYNEDTLTVVDVTDKASMVMLSRIPHVVNTFTHQGWLSEDHNMALMDDEHETDEGAQRTWFWDTRDLTNPVIVNTYYASHNSFDHNQFISGQFTYQGNYASGLRIRSIDQPNYNLTEVAYFDVFPSADGPLFQGAWSVYPFFQSGNVLVSSIEYGLYVVRPDYAAIDDVIASERSYTERARYRQILSADDVSFCTHLSEYQHQ